MYPKRRLIVGITNAIALLFVLYVFVKGNDDFAGLFLIMLFAMIFIWNIYALILNNFILRNSEQKDYLEILFYILLFLPLILLLAKPDAWIVFILSFIN